MSTTIQTRVKASPKSSFTPVHTGLLQRKCACGGSPGLDGECAQCRDKRLNLQRRSMNETEPSEVPPIVHEVLHSPGQPLDAATRAFMEPRFGHHDFIRVRVNSTGLAGEAAPPMRESKQTGHHLFRADQVQAKMRVAPQQDAHEQLADKIAQQVVRHQAGLGPVSALAAPGSANTSPLARSADGHLSGLPVDAGVPLSLTTRRFAEPAFDQDFSQVRLHTSRTARLMVAGLGARAFTHGNDIWLGPHESESDKLLMAHELAHVVQQSHHVIYLRRATWLERRAWLSFFSHYLPRKLLNNYMDDTGAEITLTQQEMIDCNPIVDLRRSRAFLPEVARLRAAGGGTTSITVSGWGGALTNGTLGNFTINYRGQLIVSAAGDWNFDGMMDFYDYWDFDPKPFGSGSGRPIPAEIKVRVAAAGIPGRPFHVRSVQVPVRQTSADARATWGGGTPLLVRESLERTGADIEVGAGAGEVVGGAGTVDVGAEVGAQSAEDLNR